MSETTRLCFISRNYRGTGSAGNKAKTDNEDTLATAGAKNLGLRRTLYRNKVVTFFLDLMGIVKFSCSVRKNDIVLLQYPVKKYFSFICNIAHLKNAQTIALIHDLGSFRRKKLTTKKEIDRLMHADYVIASNGTMRQWLQDQGYCHPVGELGLFDYRSAAENVYTSLQPQPTRIVYAGGLAMRKNAFLLKMAQLPRAYEMHIFGNSDGLPGLDACGQVTLHPFMAADDFIHTIDAHYGLVWDGDSIDSCTGDFGEYLRYNSPHKASFYLRAGLPIIIWEEAAIAPIVVREGAGFSIKSLLEIDNKLRSITHEQYNQMRSNAKRVARQLNSGSYLLNAVKTAITELQQK